MDDKPQSNGITAANLINILIVVFLGLNLHVFSQIAAGIRQISAQLSAVPGEVASIENSASNVVNLGQSELKPGPRTVEDVAAFLGVTPDTVRDSYIPTWIAAGLMAEKDRVRNRWLIPDTFSPYRPK